MTIGEKILDLNLAIQRLHHYDSPLLFTKIIPDKLQDIKDFISLLHFRHSALEQPSADCLKAIEAGIEEAQKALADTPPSDFLKDSRLLSIKEKIRKALMSIYDSCCEEHVNIVNSNL